jgi:ribosomal protein S18 acetylase RimI-like enzyme
MNLAYRPIDPSEYAALEDFLYHAIFLPPGTEPLPREAIRKPDIYVYIDGFGGKKGDVGVVADDNGRVAGAAWTRIIPAYGHIDDETPELAISVLPDYRGQGIGTRLLDALFDSLLEKGFKRTSLSVQKENPALRLYRRAGYKIVSENAEDYIMARAL